jgi:FkbM family methyltransferase
MDQNVIQQLNNVLQRFDGVLKQLIQGQLAMKRRVYGLEALNRLHAAGREPRLPVMFRSQFGEDLMLWDLFDGQLDGTYIECGAFDGQTFSVSWIFEALGWTGLLVEGTPARAQQCREVRPNSRVEHAALSRRGSSGTTKFTVVEGPAGDVLSFLSTSDEHRSRVAQQGGKPVEVEVPLTTMDNLLDEKMPTIDWAVIDVEGGEAELLDGFDLNKHRPRVLIVEDNYMSADSAVAKHMAQFPYTQVSQLYVNRVYVRNDETAILQRATTLTP